LTYGNPLTDHDVWLQFRRITEKAGLGTDWSPRELRHTFVSLLSDSGVPIEQIADAVRHSRSSTTENVYRHQLRPVLRPAAPRWARCSLVDRTKALVKFSLPVRLPYHL
jgi:integrase